jgi:tetraprenyl-beta-curcumene synthase
MSGGTHTRLDGLFSRIRLVLSVVSALLTYRRAVLPQVRGELRRWERWTVKIPDLVLRDAALSAIKEKSSNVEATAVFAILAPRSQRSSVLRAMTALQTTIEYLDVIGEQLPDEPLADGLALHGALVEAMTPGAPSSDWYRLHPQTEDGGYLAELVATCQREVATLPSSDTVRATAQQAARRCAEGQSYTHAAVGGEDGAQRLEAWAASLDEHGEYFWWELAAGASSSVALHALIAAAAHHETDLEEAERIDAAYFPPIGALTVLLDDLIDREDDVASGEHNYLDYYASNEIAAERFALLAHKSRSALADLRLGRQHTAILMGVGGFYLSTPAAKSIFAGPIKARMLEALGPAVYPILAAMRFLRRD